MVSDKRQNNGMIAIVTIVSAAKVAETDRIKQQSKSLLLI